MTEMMSPALRIGYVPYSANLTQPSDRRRFVAYARSRGISFEIASPEKYYDLVVVSEFADTSVWSRYSSGKIVFDFIDSFLAIPRSDLKHSLRGVARYVMGKSRHLQVNLWRAMQDMCRRADAVICSTEEQRHDIEQYCANTHIILDVHAGEVRCKKEDYASGTPFNLVWEGLPSNIGLLKEIGQVLHAIERQAPLVLNLVTDLTQARYLGRFGKLDSLEYAKAIFEQVVVHEWNEATCASVITGCDLGVIPIDLRNPFAVGKPENKLLLLWRMGMPVVTSATPAYRRAMHGAGLKSCCTGVEEWISEIERLAGDQSARRHAGQLGMAYAEQEFSEAKTLERWDKMFMSIGFDFHRQSLGLS